MCWGGAFYGQLGYGNKDNIGDDEDPVDAGVVNIGTNVTATSMSCGDYHTCIITNNGDVMCWGYGSTGRLGYGDQNNVGDDEDPVDAGVVNIGTNVTAMHIDCGSEHTCIITNNGDVMCWGYGGTGRLGYGDQNNVGDDEDPVDAGVVNIGTNVTATSVSTGYYHTCIITNNGDVMCWGYASYGQLGYGDTESIGDNEDPDDAGVVNIGTGVTATNISCGDYHTCIITDDGNVMCWGRGSNGRLGYGDMNSIGNDEDPVDAGVVNIGAGVTATSISCGNFHTCIITNNGDVMCWGWARDGQLGYGATDDIGDNEDPVDAGVLKIGTGVTATSVSCGAYHTCIITNEGNVMCSGLGDYGRLGYGNQNNIGDDEYPKDAGTVDVGVSTDSCEQCSAGFYPDTTSVPHLCKACSYGTVSTAGAKICTSCSGTTFYSEVTQSCIQCYGASQPTYGHLGCLLSACPTGEVFNDEYECVPCGARQVAIGETTCENCPDDERVEFSSQTCVECGDGKVPNSAGDGCVECGIGEYEASPGTCSPCATGFVAVAGSATCTECDGVDEAPDSSQETCETCALGFIPASDNSACEACPSGELETSSGSCEACGVDEWADAENQECVECGDGKVPNGAGDGCVDCGVGEYESSPGTCSPCATGFVAVAGSATCTECDGDNVAADSSQETCETCGDGYVSASDNSACEACPIGSVESSPGVCTPCDGTDQYAQSLTSCGTCPGGQIPSSDRSSCDLCPGGTYEKPKGKCNGICNEYSNSYSPPGSSACSRCTFMLLPTSDRGACAAPCESVDCTSNGICYLDVDNEPVCACGIGYQSTVEPPSCEAAPVSKKKSCKNGKIDGLETDVDCGGGTCEECPVGFYCDSTASCQDGLVCERDASSPVGGTCSPDLIKRGIPLYVDRVELNGLGTAQIRLAAARLIAEAFMLGITDLTQAVVDAVDMNEVIEDVENARRLQSGGNGPTAYLNFTLTFNSSTTDSTSATTILSDFLADPHGNNTSPLAMEVEKIASARFMDKNGLIVIGTRRVGVRVLAEITEDKEPEDTIEYDELKCNGKDEYKGATGCRDCGDGEVANDDNDGCVECLRGEKSSGVCNSLYPTLIEAGIIVVIVLIFVCSAGFIYILCRRHRQTVEERRRRLGLTKTSATDPAFNAKSNPMHREKV